MDKYYKLLGVNKNASKDEIRQAYLKRAKQFHPDMHTHSSRHVKEDALLKFRQAEEAYQTLIKLADNKSHNRSSGGGYGYNDSKRADYNTSAHSGNGGNGYYYRKRADSKSSNGSSSESYGYGHSKRTDYRYSNGSSSGGHDSYNSKRADYKSSNGSSNRSHGYYSGKNYNQSGYKPRSSTTSREFFVNVIFVSVLFVGAVIVRETGEALLMEWRKFKDRNASSRI